MELKVDPKRITEYQQATNIPIRAQGADGRYGVYDLVHLDKASLLTLLRSRGGDNSYAENVVGMLLGHGHLHPLPADAKAGA